MKSRVEQEAKAKAKNGSTHDCGNLHVQPSWAPAAARASAAAAAVEAGVLPYDSGMSPDDNALPMRIKERERPSWPCMNYVRRLHIVKLAAKHTADNLHRYTGAI